MRAMNPRDRFDENLRRAFISKVAALLKPGERAEDHPDRNMITLTPGVLNAMIDEARHLVGRKTT